MNVENIVDTILNRKAVVFRKDKLTVRVFVCEDFEYPEDWYVVKQYFRENDRYPFYEELVFFSKDYLKVVITTLVSRGFKPVNIETAPYYCC